MKYFVLLGDGMADYRCDALGGRTPLEAADKPNMDYLARHGVLGRCITIPDSMTPESDTANLSLLGYNPEVYSRGRSPLEAVSMGIDLKPEQAAVRANLVTLSGEGDYASLTMDDNTGGEITTAEARVLIESLDTGLCSEGERLYAGISYRHCLILDGWDGFRDFTRPHDIIGKPIKDYLPPEPYLSFQSRSRDILENHPVNLRRAAEGKKKANSVWLWSPGTRPALPDFRVKTGLSGAVVCAVDLIKGIGLCAGMEVPDVPGATGGTDTDYSAKERAAEAMFNKGHDFVYVHVEAPDEYGHQGDPKGKTKAIERLDSEILRPMLSYLESSGDAYRVLVCPDHFTPVSIRTHARGAVPFVIYDSRRDYDTPSAVFTEECSEKGGLVPTGSSLTDEFLRV